MRVVVGRENVGVVGFFGFVEEDEAEVWGVQVWAGHCGKDLGILCLVL